MTRILILAKADSRARRSVIAEGCEAAVVDSTELFDRYVF